MSITGDYNLTDPLKEKFNYFGTFQTKTTNKSSDTVNFFEQLYSQPQKLNLKWDLLNGVETKKVWQIFNNVVYRWDPDYEIIEKANTKKSKYLFSDYLEGFFNRINSSRFYSTQTKDIQTALASVPIFVVLNGDNEIVLTKSINPEKPSTLKTYAERLIYNTCGSFDLNSEGCPNFGLFFFDYTDAENYLNSIAKSDIDGTKTVGLSVHCIGLNSAYKITREYHPEVDFRFISQLSENNDTITGVPIYIVNFYESSVSESRNKFGQAKPMKVVFFDETSAREFYKTKLKEFGSKMEHGLRLSVDSLENFFEVWEEQIQAQITGNNNPKTNYTSQNTYFVTTTTNDEIIQTSPKITKVTSLLQAFKQKTRILKRSIGIFFSLA